MDVSASVAIPVVAGDKQSERWVHYAAAAGSLVLMLWLLGTPPVQRTQEARVLVVAREMLGKGWQDWLVPHINGAVRVQKPPLAYWLAAAAFRIGGVSEGVGRVPFALAGWATLMLTCGVARWLFGSPAALLAGGVLAASLMFARHARLAETDILATLFLTGAIGCILRGWSPPVHGTPQERKWFAVSGVMIGMTIFAKGLPALFIFVFLLEMAVVERDLRTLWRWCRSGAPLLALLVGAPWYVYIFMVIGIQTFVDETRIGLVGMDHKSTVLGYIPDLLRAVAPWMALTLMGGIVAAFSWRRDWRIRGLLLWAGAVLLPLAVGGQRQYHYILPALPALAILTGWLLDEALTRRLPHWKIADALLLAMFVVMFLGMIAIPIIAVKVRPGGRAEDYTTAAVMGIAAVVGLWACIRTQEKVGIVAIALMAIAVTIVTQSWLPSLETDNSRAVARQVRALAPGPLCFYGENISFPLIFHLQRIVPRYQTPDELSAAGQQEPDLVVIAQTKANHTPPPLPASFQHIGKIEADEQIMDLYRQPK